MTHSTCDERKWKALSRGRWEEKHNGECCVIFSPPFLHLERHFPFMHIKLAVIGIEEPSEAMSFSYGEGKGSPAPGLMNDNNKREMFFQGGGAQRRARRNRGFGAEASSEPGTSVISSSVKKISPLLSPSFSVCTTSGDARTPGSHTPSDRASTGIASFKDEGTRLVGVLLAFKDARRLHFVVSFLTCL